MEEIWKEKIDLIVEPIIAELNLELVELSIKRRSKTVVIDIVVDKLPRGITMDECASFNRKVAETLEVENFIDDDYVVEVSSPGIDRPLKTAKDFLRVMGRDVRFHLIESVENKVEHSGIITQVDGENILVQTKKRMVIIPLNKINKAVQIII